jgi:hypothetical protein
MTQERINSEDKKSVHLTRNQSEIDKKNKEAQTIDSGSLFELQRTIGNRAVQRLVGQRKVDGPTELDDETADRINKERSGGSPLDDGAMNSLGSTLGHDFSKVRVHTSSEAADLNKKLNARAFTTGQDIFFQEGAYTPETSSGKELLVHELTHVVQQSTGMVGGGNRMTVNLPDDIYEQQADAAAHSALSGQSKAAQSVQARTEQSVQAQEEEEEEEVQASREPAVQMQAEEEEEEVQTAPVQEQDEEEEEV